MGIAGLRPALTSAHGLAVALTYCAAALPPQAGAAAPACTTQALPPLTVHDCIASGVSVIETQSGIEPILRLKQATGLATLAASRPGMALIFNGSYHDGNYGNATLAGWFVVQGRELSVLRANDPQLSQVVRLDGQGRIASIGPVDAVDPAAASAAAPGAAVTGTVFQTGPLVLDAGRVAHDSIAASLNGSGAYKRTALGRAADGTTVVAIARRPLTLLQFAAEVQAVGDFRHRGLTLVNLDGGFSTAWVVAADPKLNYQPDKQTPVAFGVRADGCEPECPQWVAVPRLRADGQRDDSTAADRPTAAGTLTVSRSPVTVRQWARCGSAGGCGSYRPAQQGRSPDSPVVNVSLQDAGAYATWLADVTGRSVRLVREDEWAWLVLAGTPGPFPWGATLLPGRANCLGCGSRWDSVGTSPVGSFAPNALDLLDMAGNVAQWLDAPPSSSAVPPRCAAQAHTAAIGGASWADPPRFIDPQQLSCVDRGLRDDTIGFRVAVDPPVGHQAIP